MSSYLENRTTGTYTMFRDSKFHKTTECREHFKICLILLTTLTSSVSKLSTQTQLNADYTVSPKN